MKCNFLYQITAASRDPDSEATAPRSPFSVLSPQLNFSETPPPRTKFLDTSLVDTNVLTAKTLPVCFWNDGIWKYCTTRVTVDTPQYWPSSNAGVSNSNYCPKRCGFEFTVPLNTFKNSAPMQAACEELKDVQCTEADISWLIFNKIQHKS